MDLSFDFLTEPVWQVCACGAKTNQVPCWDCRATSEKRIEKRYADAVRDRSIFDKYRDLTEESVLARVRSFNAAKLAAFTRFVKANPRQSITFVGAAAAGKTTLATWALVNNPLFGFWVRAGDLERSRKEQALGKGPAAMVDEAEKAGVLVLDEVRTEGVAFGATFDVLDYRHGRNLPTYATTGLDEAKLGAALGDGGVRRLFEEPGVRVVRL